MSPTVRQPCAGSPCQLHILQATIETGPAIVFVYRAGGAWPVEFITQNIARLGFEADDFCSGRRAWIDLLHPDDRRRVLDDLSRHIDEGAGSFAQEYRVLARDGQTRWMENHNTIVPDPAGGIIRVQGIALDITERKLAEETVRLHSEVLANMAEGVFLSRCSDQRIVYANPTMERMFGYGRGELIGKHTGSLEASGDKTPLQLHHEIVGQLKANGFWNGEMQNVRKDGTHFWSRTRITTFRHSDHGEMWVGVRHDITERKEMEDRLRRANQDLQRLAHTDLLTALPNRRCFIDTLTRELDRQQRYGGPLSIALVDVDHFKSINDTFGHDAGDRVLAELAAMLRRELRVTDVVARWGGDEFTVLMPATPLAAGIETIDRLRKKLITPATLGKDGPPGFTISAGMVCADDEERVSLVELLRRADQALYVAKAAGRNRVATTEIPSAR